MAWSCAPVLVQPSCPFTEPVVYPDSNVIGPWVSALALDAVPTIAAAAPPLTRHALATTATKRCSVAARADFRTCFVLMTSTPHSMARRGGDASLKTQASA